MKKILSNNNFFNNSLLQKTSVQFHNSVKKNFNNLINKNNIYFSNNSNISKTDTKNFLINKYLIKPISKNFCVFKETAIAKPKKFEKVKNKFTAIPPEEKSGLLLLEKNIISNLDTNLSPKIKQEIDSGLKISKELEKEMAPMAKIDAYHYMKSIDSKFESFFHQREFNIRNFNYYLQVLSSQGKTNDLILTMKRMGEMGIQPNNNSYIILMNSYAKEKNIKKCEKIFSIIKKRSKGNVHKYAYNTLLLAYAKNAKFLEAEAIFNEMKRKELIPDAAVYTTLIHAYKRAKMYSKCWEIYDNAVFDGQEDEFLTSYMIKLAGYSKDVNNALRLYEYFELQGYNFYTINYNSILWALSNNTKYAEKTLEIFRKMKFNNVMPDTFTYVCVLQATARLGDINTANECLKEMKHLNVEINEYICTGLMNTYAGAAKIPYVKLEHLEEYAKDAFAIFNFMEENDMKISSKSVDALLSVYCQMHKLEEAEGIILPLYEKYGLEYTSFTYENLVRMLFDVREYDRVLAIYEKLNKEKDMKIKFNKPVLDIVIETGIRTNDSDLIVGALENFHLLEKNPKRFLLRHMANMENLPDSLYVELRKWIDTDKIGRKFRAFSPAQVRERSHTPVRISKRRGRRIK